MYRPPAFREDRLDVLHALIDAHRLGILVTHGPEGLTANLVPFTLDRSRGQNGTLRAHLAKANEQHASLLAGGEALVIFQGPQSYITPSWYPSKAEHAKVVPTWNYVVVEARGTPIIIDDAAWLRVQPRFAWTSSASCKAAVAINVAHVASCFQRLPSSRAAPR